MRLLIVSQYFWPEEFRVNDLAAGLVERGHEVVVLTNPPNYPGGEIYPAYRTAPSEFTNHRGVEVIRVPVIPRGSRAMTLALNYFSFVVSACLIGPWKLRNRSFDAIFCFQTTPVTAALPAILIGRLRKLPVTMWVLDLWPESLSAVGAVKNQTLLGMVGALVRFVYRRLDRILISSAAFRDSLARHGADARRVEEFPNWIEPEFMGSQDARPAPETSDFASTFNVMFAGNIGEAQDLPAVLDAAEMTRDIDRVRWLIVGEGRRADALRTEIGRRGLADRVIMLGRHPTHRMPEFFAAADALLVSLKDEPLFRVTVPGKIQSYLASGKPVLAMLTGEGARIVAESGGGIASPAGDAAALAASVRRLVDMSAEQREAMGGQGLSYCQRHYGRDDLLDRLEMWLSKPVGPTCM